VHLKITVLSLLTHSHVFPDLCDFFKGTLEEKFWKMYWSYFSVELQRMDAVTEAFKHQRHYKNMIKVFHMIFVIYIYTITV